MKPPNLIIQAKQFAEKAHSGQTRKLNNEPFMNHPNHVADTLIEAGFSDVVVAAGYLHDVVEDTVVPLQEIEQKFGLEVCRLVNGNTENRNYSWEKRKLQTIENARVGSLEVKALIAADKFDNLTNVMHYYKVMGESVWSVFVRGKKDQYWYYSEVAKALFMNIDELDIPLFFYEYKRLVEKLHEILESDMEDAK
ncbi:HD domain-containing protein [Bacillus massiliigorillae]|uniref:HD domain-containing protein n=1 Tax=Bacillus massiliigorillae TaxID=1243664 RepID=UPI00039CA689|nr:HD domain-containing protein [Bacillus massiliigorillae]